VICPIWITATLVIWEKAYFSIDLKKVISKNVQPHVLKSENQVTKFPCVPDRGESPKFFRVYNNIDMENLLKDSIKEQKRKYYEFGMKN
jgi:hypothetical protein